MHKSQKADIKGTISYRNQTECKQADGKDLFHLGISMKIDTW